MDLQVDGARVHAATGGRAFDRERPAIIFLHGAGCDHTTWMLPARWFAHHGFSVLVPDLAGHGRSEGNALATIAEWSLWTERLMRVAEVPHAALVGHSMGGAIAIETAARLKDRVTHVGLIGTAAAIPVGPALLEAAKTAPEQAYDMMTAWGHGPRGRLGGSPIPGLWMSGGTRAIFNRCHRGALATDLAACSVWQTGKAAAGSIVCPAAVITGSLDVMTPAKRGAELAALIEGAKLTAIEGVGHMIPAEAPDACLDALIELTLPRTR
jgi:pimeloyl-ACP methyl ester carboxylesterase